MGKWTKEEEAVLRAAHAEGLTFSGIASRLPGRDRNMVAGKCWRLGLCERLPMSNFSGRRNNQPGRGPITMLSRERVDDTED